MDSFLRNNSSEEIQFSEDEIMFSSQKSNISSRLNEIVAFQSSIQKFQEKLNLELNGIIELIKDFIVVIKTEQTKYNQLFSYAPLDYQLTMDKVNQNLNNAHKKFNEAVIERLNNLKDSFESYSLNVNFYLKSPKLQKDIDEQKQYSYQINNFYQQNEHCQAIAINKFNSIVIAGCNTQIKFFNLKMNNEHLTNIRCLKFMQNSQQPISGCNKGTIIIWHQNSSKQWYPLQKLQEHSNLINSLILNQNEDLMISSSSDESIKFWLFKEKWECVQSLNMNEKVYDLSINEQNQVLARTNNGLFILEKNGNLWNSTQIMKSSFIRFCCIDNDQISAQLNESELFQIFVQDQKDKQYKLVQEIKVKYGKNDYNLFPMQYVKQKGLLIDKNCQYVNILKRQKTGDFKLVQTLDFQNCSLYGCASENGEYLFTWDKVSKQIQVRKLMETI